MIEELRDMLYGTPAFSPLRAVYQRLFKREHLAFRRWLLNVYAPFVSANDLVFDVGANIGLYSEVFSELGARVVAVEPNPQCYQRLDRLSRIRQVTIERCAVSDHEGTIPFHICTTRSVFSTASEDWLKVTRQTQSTPGVCYANAHWLEASEVKCVTLDMLAKQYGVPNFVKIDVEGHDDAVLRGMSFQPQALSFEFTLRMPQVALRCLEALDKEYEFNFIYPTRPLGKWMDAKELRHKFLIPEREYGDVVAKLETTSLRSIHRHARLISGLSCLSSSNRGSSYSPCVPPCCGSQHVLFYWLRRLLDWLRGTKHVIN